MNGEGGIRTLDSLIGYTRFRDGPVQPLRHLSNEAYYTVLTCAGKSPIFPPLCLSPFWVNWTTAESAMYLMCPGQFYATLKTKRAQAKGH